AENEVVPPATAPGGAPGDGQVVHEQASGRAQHLDEILLAGSEAYRKRDPAGLRLAAGNHRLLGVEDDEAERAVALGGGGRNRVGALVAGDEGEVIDVAAG